VVGIVNGIAVVALWYFAARFDNPTCILSALILTVMTMFPFIFIDPNAILYVRNYYGRTVVEGPSSRFAVGWLIPVSILFGLALLALLSWMLGIWGGH